MLCAFEPKKKKNDFSFLFPQKILKLYGDFSYNLSEQVKNKSHIWFSVFRK